MFLLYIIYKEQNLMMFTSSIEYIVKQYIHVTFLLYYIV